MLNRLWLHGVYHLTTLMREPGLQETDPAGSVAAIASKAAGVMEADHRSKFLERTGNIVVPKRQ